MTTIDDSRYDSKQDIIDVAIATDSPTFDIRVYGGPAINQKRASDEVVHTPDIHTDDFRRKTHIRRRTQC